MRLLSGCLILLVALSVRAEDAAPVIDIEGAPERLTDNIRAHLSLADEICDLNDRRLKPLLRRTNEEIFNAGKALGYYHLNFEKQFERTESCWRLLVEVTPGDPVYIESVDVRLEGEAEHDGAFKRYIDNTPPRPGDQLDHGAYERLKSGLRDLAIERGYFDAQFNRNRLLIDPEGNRADIDIIYASGPRFDFGKAQMDSEIISDDLLSRYKTFESGEPYNNERLLELQRALENAGYFSRVTVQPRIEQRENGRVPVHVDLRPRKQHSYAFGVGAATDTGPRLRFEYENRYLNRDGHKLDYDLTLSPVRSETRLNYRIPMQKPGEEHLNFYAGYATEDNDTTDEQTATLGSSYSQVLKRDWLQTYFLKFQRETFVVADVERRSDLLIPGIIWAKTDSDDPFYPTDGWHASLEIKGASEDLLSDTSFLQGRLNAKVIQGVGFGRLILRGDVGSTEVDDFNALPTSVRFFAGGDNSVRGYKYRSLGPTNENGDVVGGANLLVGSVEYDFRFTSNWAFAVFYDQGNAFDETNTDSKRGAGIGLRWISPIGPIRLDLASALDNDNELRVHVSMGPDL